MKIAILSRAKTYEVLSMKIEAQKRGHLVDILDPKDLVFSVINNQFKIFLDSGIDLLEYEAYIPRYFGITVTSNNKKNSKSLIVKYLLDNNKIVLDKIEGERLGGTGKIYSFSKYIGENIPLIPTLFSYHLENLNFIEEQCKSLNISAPYILKDINGAQGRNIFKIETLKEVKEILKENPSVYFMLQPYIEFKNDLRILVLGGKILGVMDKIHSEDNFKGNISQGAIGKNFIITDDIKDIVYKSYFTNKADFVGIDIGVWKNSLYLLEVNRSPQFQGVDKYLGINVAQEIIKYLEYQYIL